MKSLLPTIVATLLATGCATPQQTVHHVNTTDKLTGETSQSRMLKSDNEAETSGNGVLNSRLLLIDTGDVLGFSVNHGVMLCRGRKITIRYSIDGAAPETMTGHCSVSLDMFAVPDKAVAARMVNSKRLVVQVPFVSTVAQYTFNTASFVRAGEK